jgi:hypothetical protein
MEIRRAAGLVVAAVAVFGFATAASAQRFAGPGFGADEARANPLGLLLRIDVQTHLRMDLKQKQALDQLINGAREQRQQQFQQLRQNRPPQNNAEGLSREERRQQGQQFGQQMREQMMAFQQKFEGELSEQIKQLLRPEQLTRLYQLDYQHRGPLALADPQVAQAVKLSPETQQKIAPIVNEYRNQAAEMRRAFFQEMFQNNQQGQQPQAGQPGPGGRRPNFQDLQQRMGPLQQNLAKLKAETEAKIIALLTPEEKANWQALQGAPFTFRKDIQTENPLFQGRGGFGRGQGGPGGPGGGFGRGQRGPGGARPL